MSEKFIIARLTSAGDHFEIVVDPDRALNYRMGKPADLDRVLVADSVFADAKKGLKASSEKLTKAFGTDDVRRVADAILKKGELQITTEQRKRLVEEKRRQIVSFIARNCLDPRTNLPHPALRIEQALSQVRVSIEPFRDAEAQAREVIDRLRPILPIKMEQMRLAVRIPAEHVAKAYGALKEFGVVTREEWQSDGSWAGAVEMPAGVHAAFLDRLGKTTKGTMQTRILK